MRRDRPSFFELRLTEACRSALDDRDRAAQAAVNEALGRFLRAVEHAVEDEKVAMAESS